MTTLDGVTFEMYAMMTYDEKLEMYAKKYGRDVFAAIYDIENLPPGLLYSCLGYVREMIEIDNRIEENISNISNTISAECTSDKEYWDNMSVCLDSLYLDGNPSKRKRNMWTKRMKKNNHI